MRGITAGGPGIMPPVPPTTTIPKDSPELRAVYDEFNKLLITDTTDLGKMKEPLLIWAYDDTVKPNNSYRYKIRLGVFNPIAGTDKLQDSENPLKDKAILWTDFVEAPEIIEVPGRTCFFAKDIQEAEKKVTVTIYRYTLGSWYGSDFYVRPGDLIGKNVVLESVQNENPIEPTMINPFQLMNTKPKNVDYSTGAVVVDALKVNAWTGTSKIYQRSYSDMLYSFDGTEITHMPVGSANWPSQLSILYNNIKTLEKEPKQPFKPWSDRTARRTPQQTQPTTPTTMPGYEEMQREMMMRIIQGQGRIN
jgi:hypothetical protein